MRRRDLLVLPLLPVTTRAAGEPGFTPLFDGRTLAGWRVKDGPESAFYVSDGAIVVHTGSNYPAWLSTRKQHENFDFRGEFFVKGWTDSGIYLHAPEHGRNTWCGLEINLFHQQEPTPTPYSCGAVFPLVAPRKVNVRGKGEWNTFRILMDWPSLRVWLNGELVQDLDLDAHPDLRYRLRRGYIGLESLSYPIRFRALELRELPAKEQWEPLYVTAEDFARWRVSEGAPRMEALGGVLRAEGLGHFATRETYRDFYLQGYIRTSRAHNGGVVFRSEGKGTRGRGYEIQLHNVENAHFPTGSLYHYQRSTYSKIADEQWWLFQLFVRGRTCVVRINGENVLEYGRLENVEPGVIELQAHQNGAWAEFKDLRIRRL